MSDKVGVVVRDRQVVIYLDLDGAEWLAGELPQSDGFTRDVHRAVAELSGALTPSPSEPT